VFSKFDDAEKFSESALDARLVAALAPESLDAQSVRMVRTALNHAATAQGGSQVIQFTSPTTGEGATVALANVAVALASTGKRVLVVDANMRCPMQHHLLGVGDGQGLSELLADQAELTEVISSTSVANLDLLAAGTAPPHPAELLAMPRFDQLIKSLRDRYDFVLIDTPSILDVSDGLAVTQQVDGVVLVIATNADAVTVSQQAIGLLERFDARVIGTIVNDLENRMHPLAGRYANGQASMARVVKGRQIQASSEIREAIGSS
jgi:capsular exopolysaccharide synthesis family protein